MKNSIYINGDYAILLLKSKKFGYNEVFIDIADVETVSKYQWYANKKKNSFYCQTSYYEDGIKKNMKLHRLITNCPRNKIVDHIDRNGLNNTRKNLRIVDHVINNRNKSYKNKQFVNGIHYNKKSNSIRASWYDDKLKRHFKTFSIKKYGYDEAINRAMYYRYKNCIKYNYILDEEFMKKVVYKRLLKIIRIK